MHVDGRILAFLIILVGKLFNDEPWNPKLVMGSKLKCWVVLPIIWLFKFTICVSAEKLNDFVFVSPRVLVWSSFFATGY